MEPDRANDGVRFDVTCGTDEPVTLTFEPTGMEYELARGDRITVGIRESPGRRIEIEYLPGRLVVWSDHTVTEAWDAEGRPLPV